MRIAHRQTKSASLMISEADKNNDVNIKSIKRFASPVILEKEPAVAYITVKESLEAGHRVYSLELFEIKKFGGKLQGLNNDKHLVAPNSIFSLNKKIDDVNNCSKVVDENGEPMVVYHGTNGSFKFYNGMRIAHRQTKKSCEFKNLSIIY